MILVNSTRQSYLPKKEFYSQTSVKKILEDEDYEKALHIWKHFNIKNLGEYHDLYLENGCFIINRCF